MPEHGGGRRGGGRRGAWWRHGAARLVLACIALAALGGLSGCSTLGYYWQSASGHLRLMGAARPLDDWLAAADTPSALRERLELARRLRTFAARELHLPDNASYTRYADLRRRAAVWNVVAAPAYSLNAQTWCFPVVGCVAYRGYYDEAAARALARELEAQGLETAVQPVPAYSTLGWSNWVGGDPLLNTFITYPEGDLARLIFHELAHQVLYVSGDTTFNESFATAVERIGARQWLLRHGSAAQQQADEQGQRRRGQFNAMIRETRAELLRVYAGADAGEKARAKARAMQALRDAWSRLRSEWGLSDAQLAGRDAWVAHANNASLAAHAAYDELVPAFEALHASGGGDWARFYDAVRRIAALPDAASRRAALGVSGLQARNAD